MGERRGPKGMAASEFEDGYAFRSGTTVDELHAQGRGAVACDCDDPDCGGWRMVNVAELLASGGLVEAREVDALRAKADALANAVRWCIDDDADMAADLLAEFEEHDALLRSVIAVEPTPAEMMSGAVTMSPSGGGRG